MRSNMHAPVQRVNWSIIVGLVIIALTILLALFGPAFSPRDPLERTFVLEVNGRMQGPPFPMFASDEFPLGSDRFGRDLLSQLLWAVRPTLLLVTLVSFGRMVLGVVAGVFTGWSDRRLARGVGAAMAFAVSVPVLFIALGFIALFGAWNLALAFLAGLIATGWAETALLVRNETRVVKTQLYIEAVRALGQSEMGIVTRHVLRQLTPMLLVTFPIEMAATLLTVAALGYLGYYIGGDAWVMVTDFVAQRLSALPELGQLLGVTSEMRDHPLALLTVGSIIFIIVMGFNLLGNGLRTAFALQNLRRSARYLSAVESMGALVSERVREGLFADRRRRKLRWALAGGAVATLTLFVLGVVLLPQLMRAQTPALPIAGDHLWATTRRDMQGTLRSAVTGLTQPTASLVFSHTAGYAGGPVITRDGLLIINTLDQYVQCIEPQGKLVWQTELEAVPIGAPTLGATDDVYVADVDGGLTRLTLQGQVIWRAEPGIKAPAMAGPLIDERGNVVVLTEGYLWSSDGQGNVRWQTPTPYTYFNTVPRLSLDQRTVFFADVALDAESGAMLLEPSVAPLDQFMTGAQGQLYLHTDTSLMEWRVTPQGIALVEATRLDYSRYFPNLAEADAGSVPGQSIWFLMSNEYLDARVIWSDYAGSYRGSVGFAQRPSRIVAIDRDFTLYACGRSTAREAQCIALEQGALEPRWKMALQQEDEVIGGALISGRLYITTRNGFLYALSDQA